MTIKKDMSDTTNPSRPLLAAALLLAVVSGGCGDPLADGTYQGDPLATVSGSILLQTTAAPTHDLGVIVGWRVERSPTDTWSSQPVSPSGGFPASYRLDLLTPPPAEALNTDQSSGQQLGFAFVVLYEDVNGNGLPDFDTSGKGLPAGPDRFRGGAELLMLAYAAADFPATSRIAKELGFPLERGYHLMRADPKFRCSWNPTKNDWSCPNARTELERAPFTSAVDLKVIDHPSEWSPVHAPDWLFLTP